MKFKKRKRLIKFVKKRKRDTKMLGENNYIELKETSKIEDLPIEPYASKILDIVVHRLKEAKLNLSSTRSNGDGRVDSSLLEDVVTNYIDNDENIINFLVENGLEWKIPKRREWYDLCFTNKDRSIFIPVNIKISGMKGSDNVSSKKGLYYAITGDIPYDKEFEHDDENSLHSNKWDEFWSKLKLNVGKRKNKDYYFLILNKNDNDDIFYTSLKTLETVSFNGSNLPFQCCWFKNKNRVMRSYEEAKEFLLKSFVKSLELSNKSIQDGIKTIDYLLGNEND